MTIAGTQLVAKPRSRLASRRAAEALGRMHSCRFCAWDCGADRFQQDPTPCHAGAAVRWFLAQTEVSDELELIPCFSIALSGCNLRCAFCISAAGSWNADSGHPLSLKPLVVQARHAVAAGARSIMILGGEPTIHLPHLLAMAAVLPDTVPLALKTNGFFSAEARRFMDGIFDIWVPDFKFGNDACALRLSGARDYTSVLEANILWASHQGQLIVRHLLMPGHLECCWMPIARWLAENVPATRVSLRAGFWPAGKSAMYPELLGRADVQKAFSFARELELTLIE